MLNRFATKISVLVAATLPFFAFAYGEGGIRDYILVFGSIIRSLIPLAAAAALLFFFWRLARVIVSAQNNENAHEEARNVIVWGILSLFVIVSIWGIVSYIQRDLGIPNELYLDTGYF